MSGNCKITITNTLPNPQAAACITYSRTSCYPRPYISINTCTYKSLISQFRSGTTCYYIYRCQGCAWTCAPFCGPPRYVC